MILSCRANFKIHGKQGHLDLASLDAGSLVKRQTNNAETAVVISVIRQEVVSSVRRTAEAYVKTQATTTKPADADRLRFRPNGSSRQRLAWAWEEGPAPAGPLVLERVLPTTNH